MSFLWSSKVLKFLPVQPFRLLLSRTRMQLWQARHSKMLKCETREISQQQVERRKLGITEHMLSSKFWRSGEFVDLTE